jgi:hypothetical protein
MVESNIINDITCFIHYSQIQIYDDFTEAPYYFNNTVMIHGYLY